MRLRYTGLCNFAAVVLGLAVIAHSTAAMACPTGGVEGQMLYNGNDKVFQYCDGTNWIAMNLPGTGSGGCANPNLPEYGLRRQRLARAWTVFRSGGTGVRRHR
jgi:hypothetical protein